MSLVSTLALLAAHQSPPSRCPYCAYESEGVLHRPDCPPSPGQITICFQCERLVAFDDALALRKLTDDELLEIDDAKLARTLEILRIAKSLQVRPS